MRTLRIRIRNIALNYWVPAEVPEEDADPGPAGVGVCCAGAHRLPVQLSLAAVGLGAHHLPAHQAHRGRARVVPWDGSHRGYSSENL